MYSTVSVAGEGEGEEDRDREAGGGQPQHHHMGRHAHTRPHPRLSLLFTTTHIGAGSNFPPLGSLYVVVAVFGFVCFTMWGLLAVLGLVSL